MDDDFDHYTYEHDEVAKLNTTLRMFGSGGHVEFLRDGPGMCFVYWSPNAHREEDFVTEDVEAMKAKVAAYITQRATNAFEA
jgi:hypothetical protein